MLCPQMAEIQYKCLMEMLGAKDLKSMQAEICADTDAANKKISDNMAKLAMCQGEEIKKNPPNFSKEDIEEIMTIATLTNQKEKEKKYQELATRAMECKINVLRR